VHAATKINSIKTGMWGGRLDYAHNTHI